MSWISNILNNRATRPASGGKPSGMTLSQRIEGANIWREQYNPLRGLDVQRAVAMMEAYQRGEFTDLMWTLYFVEQTDPDLLALIERRTSALLAMDWNIKIISEEKRRSGFDNKLAEDQAQYLRDAYERVQNLYELVEHLSLASFRGFAVAQKQLLATGGEELASSTMLAPNRFECIDPWKLVRNGMYGAYYWNPDGRNTTHKALGDAARLDPVRDGLITREVRRPIGRLAVLKFIRANMAEKDWDSFVEIYGVPSVIVIGPPNIPEGKETEYQTGAEDAADGGSGYLPNGSDVKYPDSVRGSNPFKERLDHLSEKLILAGTGGMLTMLAQSGSGTLAGGAHADTFEAIARGEARKISEVMQRQFDRPELEAQFPGQPVLAYFDLAANEEQDVGQIITHASTLRTAGYVMDAQELAENTGYNITLDPTVGAADTYLQNPGAAADAPAARQGLFNRDNAPSLDRAAGALAESDSIMATAAEAAAKDLAPLRKRINEVLTIADDADFRAELKKLQEELPAILTAIGQDSELARVLAATMASAFANGIESGAEAVK